MKALEEKIKRTTLLIKTRKAQLDREAGQLAEIKRSKIAQLKSLDSHQKSYIDGVNRLNVERQTSDRKLLMTLERGVDHSKSQWYRCLREVKQFEEQEKQQIKQVLEAQRQLRSLEIIQEGYLQAMKKESARKDQKELDEVSLSKYVSRS